ncbi:MAG: hypothetical protein ABR529_03465 [Actinomycetota bacterium]
MSRPLIRLPVDSIEGAPPQSTDGLEEVLEGLKVGADLVPVIVRATGFARFELLEGEFVLEAARRAGLAYTAAEIRP